MHWTAPEANGLKINFDGAIFVDKDYAGIGVVIRNDAGLIMASLTQQIPLPTSVIEVEALAARRALEFALELGFDDITLEGDSEILIRNLKNGGSNGAGIEPSDLQPCAFKFRAIAPRFY
ncbi:uncharacterized protein LOC136066775 [Quercus suber]|uniref:uncharacterized protein LOC136066775 n=1 Tax=Quercus suber TaxID=58331 RepID=UPI0032DF8C00